MPRKLTNEIIDQILLENNRPVKRIDDYINVKCYMNWGCTICDNTWATSTDSIVYGNHNCPKCAAKNRGIKQKFTNEIIDQKLLDKNKKIKRIGDYNGMGVKIDWLCLVCDYRRDSTPGHILGDRGYPKCNKKVKLTNDIIDQVLLENNRQIRRIGNYINNKTNIDWLCLECDWIWSARSKNILNKDTGCPQCTNHLPLTKKIVIERLNKVNIEFIDDYDQKDSVASNKKCKCKKCNYGENGEWRPQLNNIFKRHGCPMCSLNKNEKIMLSLLKTLDKNILSEYCLNKINKLARPLLFDAYSSKYNIAFEYDGIQHFEPIKFSKKMSDEQALIDLEERKVNDEYKNNFCKENDIKLIRIDGRIYKNEKLINHIKKIIVNIKEE